MRDFDLIWNDIRRIALEHMASGTPIETLDRRTQNRIVEVSEDSIERDSKGKRTGQANLIRKSEVRRIYNALLKNGKVSNSQVGTLYFSFTLFSMLPDVGYTLNPLTLHLKREERRYFILGSKYGEHNNVSVLPQMIERGVISVGFFWHDLAGLYLKPRSDIERFLVSKNEEPKSVKALSLFLQLKPGDIVAIKSTGSPLGKQPRLVVSAYAKVVQRGQGVYSFDESELGHCLAVEFIDVDSERDFKLGGYGRTIQELEDPALVSLIFESYLPKDDASVRARIRRRRRKPTKQVRTGSEWRSGTQGYIAHHTHGQIQEAFTKFLIDKYGSDHVSMEEDYVDVMVTNDGGEVLYEIKPYDLPEHCIREGIGQLLSYACFSKSKRKKELVVVGPNEADKEDLQFIDFVKTSLGLAFRYESFKV